MANKGIDYGMGQTNIDKANGIRFGVIGMNSEHLTEWAWEDLEPDYGEPSCPECGGPVVEFDSEKHGEYPEHRGCDDFACETCRKLYEAFACYGDVTLGHGLDSGGYKGRVDSDGDLFIMASPFYTRAQFCSPCAPGACHLEHPMAEGERCYCLGHDWFRGGRAPYPVFSVADDSVVYPDGPTKGKERTDESHLRTWAEGEWTLDVWTTYKRDGRGQDYLAYRFADQHEVVFEGDDFSGSPMHADDSDQTIAALLCFLSLKPGDTDKEYFDKYTPRQLEWAVQNGENLSMLATELEEAANATEFEAAAGFTLCKGENDDGEPVWTDGDRMYRPNAVGWPTDEHGQCLEGEMKR